MMCSKYPQGGRPRKPRQSDAALFFSPSQPRNAKISAETAGMSGNCCIFAAVIKKEKDYGSKESNIYGKAGHVP